MLAKEDLRSTKNELFYKHSSHVVRRSYVKIACQRKTLSRNFKTLRFLDKSLGNGLISACVLSKHFFKEK